MYVVTPFAFITRSVCLSVRLSSLQWHLAISQERQHFVSYDERVRVDGKTPVFSIEKPGFCPQCERAHYKLKSYIESSTSINYGFFFE